LSFFEIQALAGLESGNVLGHDAAFGFLTGPPSTQFDATYFTEAEPWYQAPTFYHASTADKALTHMMDESNLCREVVSSLGGSGRIMYQANCQDIDGRVESDAISDKTIEGTGEGESDDCDATPQQFPARSVDVLLLSSDYAY